MAFDDFDTQLHSDEVSDELLDAWEEFPEDEDGEPMGSHDLSDDADALASAGWGTDEDYGFDGRDDYDDMFADNMEM